MTIDYTWGKLHLEGSYILRENFKIWGDIWFPIINLRDNPQYSKSSIIFILMSFAGKNNVLFLRKMHVQFL